MRHNLTTYWLINLLTIFYSCNLGLTKCEDVQEWKISGYRIVKSKCLGPAGPHYYPLSVYNGGKFLGDNGFQKDDCTITFQASDDLYLIFDICKSGLTQLKPNKKLIDLKTVDSIHMVSNKLDETKRLTKKQIEKFVQDWNKSKTSDYRDKAIDSVFYPTYQYKLIVYSKGGTKEFLAANYLISDRTKWTFYITDNEDIEYFNKLWAK